MEAFNGELGISVFLSLTDTTPHPARVRWSDLCETFESHDTSHAQKGALPLYSCVEYAPGATRGVRGVVAVTAGVLDFDGLPAAEFARLLSKLEALGLAHHWHTTWSHAAEFAEGQRVCARLLVPLSAPVPAYRWPSVWGQLQALVEGLADPLCKDAARAYYTPSAPAGTPAEVLAARTVPGAAFDPESATALTLEAHARAHLAPTTPLAVADLQAWARKLSRQPSQQWLHAIVQRTLSGEPIAPTGKRDETLYRFVHALLREYPDAEPESVGVLLGPSLEAARVADPSGAPTVASAVEKLHRVQTQLRLERADAEKAAQAQRALAISSVLGPEHRDGYTAADIEAFARDAGVPPAALRKLWLLQKGTSFYVRVRDTYLGPFVERELSKAATQYLAPAEGGAAGLDLYYLTARGERVPKSVETLVREYGTLLSRVEIDLSAQRTAYRDAERIIVEAPTPLRVSEARYDEHIDQWLHLLAGEHYGTVCDWLAVVTRLAEPCAALYLEGKKGVGKSLFAEGVARLWSTQGSVALGDAMAAFNDSILSCPLIFADEAVPRDFRGHTRTGELRQFIQARTRTLRRKYQSDALFRGCIRLVLAANNADLISSNEQLTINDIEAIVDRVVHIECDGPRGVECQRFIQSLPKSQVAQWVDGDLLAKHALYLRDNRPVENHHRFLVTGTATKMHRRLTTSSGLRSAVCNWLVAYVLEPRRVDAMGGPRFVRIHRGRLLVNVRGLMAHWNVYPTNTRPPAIGELTEALRGLASGASRQLACSSGSFPKRINFWPISREHLLAWSEETAFAPGDTIVEALSKETDLGRGYGTWSGATDTDEDWSDDDDTA